MASTSHQANATCTKYRWVVIGLIGSGLVLVCLASPLGAAHGAGEGLNTPMAFLPIVLQQSPPTAFPADYVLNGSFESSDGQSQSGTTHWLAWWQESPKPNDGSYDYAYKPNSFNQECRSTGAASVFIYTGDCSQRVLNNWDPWWAGVKQQVVVPSGQKVRFSAYGRAWTSNLAYPAPSDQSVQVNMQVALEPDGNCDQFASTVIWSAPITPHDSWQATAVEARVGAAGRVCLILSTDYRGYSRFNLASFWDAVSLVGVP